MFDRFTDNAKKALNLARQEAQRLNHEYLGTEHILLGLLHLDGCTAMRVLDGLGTNPRQVRVEVEKLIESGPTQVKPVQLPFTLRAKKVLELSMEDAGGLGDSFIGTEHLLLGVIKEQEGVGGRALRSLGVTLEGAREKLLELRAAPEKSPGQPLDPRALTGQLSREQIAGVLALARDLLRQIHEPGAAQNVEEAIRRMDSH